MSNRITKEQPSITGGGTMLHILRMTTNQGTHQPVHRTAIHQRKDLGTLEKNELPPCLLHELNPLVVLELWEFKIHITTTQVSTQHKFG